MHVDKRTIEFTRARVNFQSTNANEKTREATFRLRISTARRNDNAVNSNYGYEASKIDETRRPISSEYALGSILVAIISHAICHVTSFSGHH